VQDLILEKVTSPIGVILIIFEARPDALPQIASLALRSGNGLILKGGKEAAKTNTCLHKIITSCFAPACDPELIGLVTNRADIDKLLSMKEYIDLVVPRGSNALVSYIQNHTSIPVLGHADGICHIYLDENVDIAQVRGSASYACCHICFDANVTRRALHDSGWPVPSTRKLLVSGSCAKVATSRSMPAAPMH
jgi:gamma-glutamyl phosphate reductase